MAERSCNMAIIKTDAMIWFQKKFDSDSLIHVMKNHLNKNLRDFRRYTKADSSFYLEEGFDKIDLAFEILDGIELNEDEIAEWIDDTDNYSDFEIIFPITNKRIHGMAYKNGKRYDCDYVSVLLKKIHDGEHFTVKTCLPFKKGYTDPLYFYD